MVGDREVRQPGVEFENTAGSVQGQDHERCRSKEGEGGGGEEMEVGEGGDDEDYRMKLGRGIKGLDDKSRGMEILMAEGFAKINPTDPLILS